jgi:phage terminase Nu1 subunit (DNA packaging protein)
MSVTRRRDQPDLQGKGGPTTPAEPTRAASAVATEEKSEAAPTGNTVIVNRHQLAAILGVHPDRISEYGQAGLPVLHRGGVGGSEESRRSQYDAILCCQWVRRHRPGGVDAQDARARLDVKRREEIELRMQVKRREVIAVDDVDRRWSAIVIEVRNTLLAVPARLKARRPELTALDILAVDALIREALEGLADRRGASNTTQEG